MPRIIMKSKYSKHLSHTANYIEYINKQGDIFTPDGDVTQFEAIEQAVRHSDSQAWFQIMSVDYNDYQKLGLNKEYFQQFLNAKKDEIAKAYNIKPKNLIMFASWHTKYNHPHLHMVFFSKDKHEGFVRGSVADKNKGLKDASRRLKSVFANTMFQGDLHNIHILKAQTKEHLNRQISADLLATIQKEKVSPQLQEQFRQLSKDLRQYYKQNPTGRKAYMYLPPNMKEKVCAMLKSLVDTNDITGHLFKTYAGYQLRMVETYADSDITKNKKMAQWTEKFFNPGKGDDTKRHNLIIKTALGLGGGDSDTKSSYRPKSKSDAAQSLLWNMAHSMTKEITRAAARADSDEQKSKGKKGFDKTKKRDNQRDKKSNISHDESIER